MSVLSTAELQQLLADDAPFGDLTTEALAIGHLQGRIQFAARYPMTVAGIEEVRELLRLAGIEVRVNVSSGQSVDSGAVLFSGEGMARDLHRAWKVAQTLVEIWSGVATATQRLVNAARAGRAEVVVACTRKNVPGTKAMAVAAVKAGGGIMHRLGLSETILVFPQHRVFREGIDLAVLASELKQQAPEKKLVIEVLTIDEAVSAAQAGFDVIQTEKFDVPELAALTARMRHLALRPVIAAAGGINPDNAKSYAQAGADVLVTSWPYTAKPCDVAVTMSLK